MKPHPKGDFARRAASRELVCDGCRRDGDEVLGTVAPEGKFCARCCKPAKTYSMVQLTTFVPQRLINDVRSR